MNIRIGHSPDPDDAFLFYALTKGKLTYPEMSFSHCLQGIEQLNWRALAGELEMTAISLHVYPYCAHHYLMLSAGASIGDGYGPILVSSYDVGLEDLQKLPIAIPGNFTTAALLLQLAAGRDLTLKIMPFDKILSAVSSKEIPTGILIHEGQLTYASLGLKKVLDLGEWWKSQTQLPVPLGVNVVRRNLNSSVLKKLAAAFKESLDYSFAHREEALAYAQQFGRGLDMKLTDRFVEMYVNKWSIECRPEGAEAMQRLLDWAAQEGITPRRVPIEFVEG